MKLKILVIALVVLTVSAVAKPRLLIKDLKIDEPAMEETMPHNSPFRDYPPGIIIDSLASQWTLTTTYQECISYDPNNDALVAVNRDFFVTGVLNTHSAPGDLTYWIDDFGVYGQDFGYARYPTAFAGDSGPYISFPFLVSGAWGGAGGQYGHGGWFSGSWDAPVDLGPGDQKAQTCIAKQCGNGNIVFLLYSTDPFGIMYRTYDRDLTTLFGQGWLTPTLRYYWGWDYNKAAGIGYLISVDDSLNLYYRSTTDGITWSAEQIYDITWPDPWPGTEILDLSWNRQMTVTDAGDPVLVFALSDGADATYPYISRVYVCPGPGQPCVQISSSFGAADTEAYYCTISTGGTKIGVVYITPRNNLDDSLCWTDIYYTQSEDLGGTWSAPVNITIDNTIRRTSIPQVSKRLDVGHNYSYILYAITKSQSDDMDLAWAYEAGIPVPSYLHLSCCVCIWCGRTKEC
jgi:hypothetical protein